MRRHNIIQSADRLRPPVITLSPTPETIDINNNWFAFLLMAGLGVFGSVITFMITSAFIIIMIFQLTGRITTSGHPGFWQVARYFLAFFLVCAILAIINFDEGRNLHVIVNRFPFLAFFPLAMALTYSRRNHVRNSLELGAVLGSILALIHVMVELSLNVNRAEGADGNAGPFAVAMCLAYTLCLLGLVRSGQTIRSLLMLSGAISAVICILASGMRVMWPLLIVIPVIAFYSVRHRNVVNYNKYLVAGLILTSSLVFLMLGELIWNRVQLLVHDIDQIRQFGQFENSLGKRLVMWDYAWHSMPDIFWHGMGESRALTGLKEFSQSEYGFPISKSHFHNVLINAVMRGGIAELIVTIALLLGPVVVTWKYRQDAISHYGFALILSIVATYTVSGTLNISFGHDIQDSLYTYLTAVGTFLVFHRSRASV